MRALRSALSRAYLIELLAPVMLAITALAALACGAPFSFVHTGKGVLRAFWQGLAEVWRIAPVALIVLHRAGRLANPDTDPFRARVLVPLARLLLAFGLLAVSYSHLKAFLPRINGALFDQDLLDADTVLGLGRPLNARLGAISASWFVELMDYAYLSFFFFFPAAMGIALFRADPDMLSEVIQSFAVVFCLGLIGYYLLPSLGTIYTHPEWHTSAMGSRIWSVRNALLDQQARVAQGSATRIHAFFGIGAFPSLHIAHALVALAIVRKRYPRAWWIGVPITAVMLVSTLFFGWHYVVDHAGAVVVAYGALKVVAWDARRRSPVTPQAAPPAPAHPPDASPDRSAGTAQ